MQQTLWGITWEEEKKHDVGLLLFDSCSTGGPVQLDTDFHAYGFHTDIFLLS